MNRTKKSLPAAFFAVVLGSAGALLAQQKTVTVEGYVLDSACAFTKNLEKPISRECALACAKEGSQLVILTKDGTIYWPIDSATPAKGQNARLTEFAGNRVTATGKLYDRGGSHALVIEQIALRSKHQISLTCHTKRLSATSPGTLLTTKAAAPHGRSVRASLDPQVRTRSPSRFPRRLCRSRAHRQDEESE